METIIFKTLLHSLWQGVLLAVLTALIVSVTTRANARLRYNLFVGCLVLFIAGVGATFCIELFKYVPSSSGNMMSLGNPVFGDTVMQTGIAKTLAGPAFIDNLIAQLNKYSSLIVLVWLLVICAKSIRFMVDIRTLTQIRTRQVYHAGTMLSEKVERLALQYGIKQKIQILQSGLIKVPMVLGHFKPLILVPLGLINGLSMEEVDAILSHEMAHIKRRDYLVNILQSVAEILFFFNPAVLWVSNMIRIEREHCCDDLAVSTVNTKMDYIKALVSCQEFATSTPQYAMAINGGKSQLVYRVQRLISSRNQSLNKLEKVIIALVLISAIGITTAFSGKETKVARVLTNERKAAQVKNDDNSDAIYKQMIRDGLAKSNADLQCTLDEDAFVINGKKQATTIHAKYAKLYLKKGQKLTYKFDKDYKKEVAQDVSPVKKTTATTDAPRVPVPPKVPRPAGSNGQKVVVQKAKGKKDMTKDLIADGLITDKQNFSYQLNDDELKVDGEKQPDAIYRKYRSKYLQHANQNITVRVNSN
jgi:bla regulator protein BlaR1